MTNPKPIYTSDNISIAYELNWSLTVFCRKPLPCSSQWLADLKALTERDAVRILELSALRPTVYQFFLSTQPQITPAQSIRSVKGRLQTLVRERCPSVFKRNYRHDSVGDANNECLQRYVARQTTRHPMADDRVQNMIANLQYYDPVVDLAEIRYGSHGQFIVNLHLVFENRDQLPDVRESSLAKTREMTLSVANGPLARPMPWGRLYGYPVSQ